MSQLPRHLLGLSKGKLESMCSNCGACCHAQVEVEKGQTVLIPELRCKNLMIKSDGESCCSVYDDRQDVAKSWCFPLAEAIEKGLFPQECPYVVEMQDYVGAQVLTDAQYTQMKPGLQKAIGERPIPEWANWTQFAEFVHGHDRIADLKKSGNFDPGMQSWYEENDPEALK